MNDPKDELKSLFKSLPEIEPSDDLRSRILKSVEAKESGALWAWNLKPALAFGSLIVVSAMAVMLSLKLESKKMSAASSPILQWTQTEPHFIH